MSLSRWLRKETTHRNRRESARRRRAALPAHCQLETLEDRRLLSAIQFAQPVYRIAEGTRSIDVTLTREDTGGADSVLVVATGGTADGKVDYRESAFPVDAVFQPGEREVTVTLAAGSPTGDQVLEGVETIELGLIENDHYDATFGAQSTATIEIHDAFLSIDRHKYIDEDAGHQSITVTLNIGEGFTLQDDAIFDVAIRADIILPAVVWPDGIRRSSASPNDYWLVTRQIRFAAGSGHGATQTIGFIPLEDDRPEGIEGFYFSFEQVSGPPFARHRSPILNIIDVPEEWIGSRPPFVHSLASPAKTVAHGRSDDDAAPGGVMTFAESARQGTVSSAGMESLAGPEPPANSDIDLLITTEVSVPVSVPAFQQAEPLPLGRMDLLAEFLSAPAVSAGGEELGTNLGKPSASLTSVVPAYASHLADLDLAFSDDELVEALTLLAPSL